MATRKLPPPRLTTDWRSTRLGTLISKPFFLPVAFGVVCFIWSVVGDPPAVQEARRRRLQQRKQEAQQQKMQALTEQGRPIEMGKSKKKPKRKSKSKSEMTPAELLSQAESFLRTGRPDEALTAADAALAGIQPTGSAATTASLPLVNLIAQIHLELGDIELARGYYLQAVVLDADGSIPESQGGGAEKFLWLAQLCSEGGQDSVDWFERGATVLRNQIATLGDKEEGKEQRKQFAGAMCGIVEIYMTDLSWEENAEAKCESHIVEALLVAPHSPEPLQTLASIRISQNKIGEAKKALMDSMELWKDLPPEDVGVPEFPTRISLVRLLLEVEAEEEALAVVKRLVNEDDQSVEAWYLGGWTLYLIGEKRKTAADDAIMHDETQQREQEEQYRQSSLVSSRAYLRECLKFYDLLDYEDVKLRDHALELVAEMDKVVGETSSDEEVDEDARSEGEGEAQDGVEDEKDEDEDEDEEMTET